MIRLRSLVRSRAACAVVAALLFALCPAIATAQSVRGHGKVGNNEISVNAWLDADGNARGVIFLWVGPFIGDRVGTSDPFVWEVIEVYFYGNTAFVAAVITEAAHSPSDVGFWTYFTFTDNSGTGEPDEVNGIPIISGEITVDDD